MRFCVYKILLVLALSLSISACACTKKTIYPTERNSTYPAKAKDCEVEFYRDAQPAKPYEIVGKYEMHIEKNFFCGGIVQLEDEGYAELRAKACELGGDAVIIDDCIETYVSETTHVHVWASVIKYIP